MHKKDCDKEAISLKNFFYWKNVVNLQQIWNFGYK